MLSRYVRQLCEGLWIDHRVRSCPTHLPLRSNVDNPRPIRDESCLEARTYSGGQPGTRAYCRSIWTPAISVTRDLPRVWRPPDGGKALPCFGYRTAVLVLRARRDRVCARHQPLESKEASGSSNIAPRLFRQEALKSQQELDHHDPEPAAI